MTDFKPASTGQNRGEETQQRNNSAYQHVRSLKEFSLFTVPQAFAPKLVNLISSLMTHVLLEMLPLC